jgi:chromosome segregation ATPase
MADDDTKGARERLQSGGEEALGRLAQNLLDNPLVTGAIARAFDAREKAVQAQEVAFNALNIPSAADIERLTRRVRSVSQRLEGIEDGVDRLDDHLAAVAQTGRLEERLAAIEEQLEGLGRQIGKLQEDLPGTERPLPREQERLKVGEPGP